MCWLGAALSETADWTECDALDTFRSSLDPAWIQQALDVTGVATLRRRRLPAEQVIWLALGMALCRNRPLDDVVAKLDLALPNNGRPTPVAKSAITQARKRVGPEPLRWLFEHSAKRWALQNAEKHAWRGLSLFAVDGTTLRVADSEENREHYGLADGGCRGPSGYPLVRLVGLLAVRSHLLLAAEIAPYGQTEHELADRLWHWIPDQSLAILDRHYLSPRILLGLSSEGSERHWLVRAKKDTSWRVVKSFGRFDKLVERKVSKHSRRAYSWLPETYIARAVSYRRPDSKGRQWLLTSLVDPEAYPANELVELYHERWEIELAYDEVKTHLLESRETIRSRTVEGVAQELWGILLTYNLIRLEMTRIAAEAGVEPVRVSFIEALRIIRDEWEWCAIASPGSIPKKLAEMRRRASRYVLPPRRRKRRYPRAVKVKMSGYPRKRSLGTRNA